MSALRGGALVLAIYALCHPDAGGRHCSAPPAHASLRVDAASGGLCLPPPAPLAEPVVDPHRVEDPSLHPERAGPVPFNREADLDRAGILAEGAEHSGEIALTFDDGPAPDTTLEVLRVLAAHRAKGAFFFTGRRLEGDTAAAEANRDVARAVFAEGHTIGNHGLDHLAVNKKSQAWNAVQIEDSARLILAATGVPPRWFRPPFGKIGEPAQKILEERRDELVMWTIDAQDTKESRPEKIAARLIAQILYAGQGIVLLHDIRPSSVRALALVLDWLEAHPRDPAKGTGYTVVDLPTYLAHAAAHPWPYQNRMQLYHVRERLHELERHGGPGSAAHVAGEVEAKPHAGAALLRKHPSKHSRKPLHKS